MFSIAICRPTGDKWKSKTLFLTIFGPRPSIVRAFSIASYPVCYLTQWTAGSVYVCVGR